MAGDGYRGLKSECDAQEIGPGSDVRDMELRGAPPSTDDAAFVAFVDGALPQVYHYLLRRVGDRSVAEELTSETLLGAVKARGGGHGLEWSAAWITGIARHKLVDHWRRQAREERSLSAVASAWRDEHWDEPLEPGRADDVLARLNPSQRAALTLRYRDGLPVAEVAELLGRSVAATENLLARSRSAFRNLYEQTGGEIDE